MKLMQSVLDPKWRKQVGITTHRIVEKRTMPDTYSHPQTADGHNHKIVVAIGIFFNRLTLECQVNGHGV